MTDRIAPPILAANEYQPRPRSGCYTCRYHRGELDNGHIVCARSDRQTIGYAARGCCYWQHEPGVDDE